MVLGAKARAVLRGSYYVSQEDIRAVAPPVLRHRIKTNFNADAEGVSPDELVRRLIEIVPCIAEEPGARGSRRQPGPEVFRSADAG
jgi:MoxR-like ATPase